MDKIKDKIAKIKQKVNEYFFMKNSIGTLSNVIRKFYVLSVEFDEIFYGTKNPKRFKLCIIFTIIMWMATFWHFLFIISNKMLSLIDNPFLPDNARICILVLGLFLILTSVVKTDILLAEIKSNLDAFRVFHILTVNLKSWHHLTYKNYKRLAIWSRIIIIVFLNYTLPFFSILLPSLILLIAILSQYLYWWIHFILFTPIYVNMIMTILGAGCVCFIYFPYYKMRFDQLTIQTKEIIPNGKGKIIFLGKEKQFLQLINEHNSLALEINKFNLQFRKSIATIWICFAFVKIITLYLTIHLNHIFTKILAVNVFIILFFFGFGLTCLFSLQINSAKKNYKVIHSVVCKYKMRLQFRLKVNLNKF